MVLNKSSGSGSAPSQISRGAGVFADYWTAAQELENTTTTFGSTGNFSSFSTLTPVSAASPWTTRLISTRNLLEFSPHTSLTTTKAIATSETTKLTATQTCATATAVATAVSNNAFSATALSKNTVDITAYTRAARL